MYITIFFLFVISIQFSTSTIVFTSLGQLNGKKIGNANLFKRIPFAKPPLGKLRFQKPEKPEKWKGARDATEYGPACMSNSSFTASPQKWVNEDCLHLNIFTSDECLKSKNCPVVVYFHGGSLAFDSAVMFNDSFLLDVFVKQDVILVIPAFRLGIFSHFVVQDQTVAPNNIAFYDIIQSLEFVSSEIQHFGGNNKRITIFGHSYGGTVTAFLAFSPRINQDLSLFQQTISMSAHQFFEPLEFQIERARRLSEWAGCLLPLEVSKNKTQTEQDLYTMKCLQSKSGLELLRIQRLLEEAGYPDLGEAVQREPLFPEVPLREFLSSPKRIPLMTGCTRIEFDHEPEKLPISATFGFENPLECEEKYRKDLESGHYDGANHTDKTQALIIPTKMRVEIFQKNNIPVFLYEYTYPKHARHTDDLFYLMGVHPFEEDENEKKLREVYQKVFINFIKYGDPGNGFERAMENRYFDIFWNETTSERPKMRDSFEEKITNYWLREMEQFDKRISARKNWRKSPKLRSGEYLRIVQNSSNFLPAIMLVICIFLIGCIAGRWSLRNHEQNAYIRIEGSNFAEKNM